MEHKLKTYRKTHTVTVTRNITLADIAKAIGVSEATVSLWESGKRTPSLASIRKIEAYTKGKVTARDFDPQPIKASA